MVELLISAIQGLCVFGLMTGAYYAIRYGAEPAAVPAPAARYDAVTTHAWNVHGVRLGHARS